MSMRGLWKIHHAVVDPVYTRDAWRDWNALAEKAIAQGRQDLVDKYQPPADWSWRRIDKRIAKLREELEKE
jgi:hypothetical protein